MRKTKVPGTNRTQTVTRATPHATYVDSRRYSHSCLPGKCTSNESLITHNRRVFLKHHFEKENFTIDVLPNAGHVCTHVKCLPSSLFPPSISLRSQHRRPFLGQQFLLVSFCFFFLLVPIDLCQQRFWLFLPQFQHL